MEKHAMKFGFLLGIAFSSLCLVSVTVVDKMMLHARADGGVSIVLKAKQVTDENGYNSRWECPENTVAVEAHPKHWQVARVPDAHPNPPNADGTPVWSPTWTVRVEENWTETEPVCILK
jgi:hypothetical protein